jgi:hypothetical protein
MLIDGLGLAKISAIIAVDIVIIITTFFISRNLVCAFR